MLSPLPAPFRKGVSPKATGVCTLAEGGGAGEGDPKGRERGDFKPSRMYVSPLVAACVLPHNAPMQDCRSS
jgi:hypothetical protein